MSRAAERREPLRSLLLLRHAKSSWDDSSRDDHDRPLDERGRRTAALLGAFLAERGPGPDLVLCSSARRTVETFERLRPLLPSEPDVEIERGLYLARRDELLERVAEVPDTRACVLLIGHNPGIEELARFLARRAPGSARESIPLKFPTAALAAFRVTGGWERVAEEVDFELFVRPKDLV
jgi:phosphohistidine phosphatase